MPEVSAFLITKNEAADVTGCLESLRGLADEMVVVDDHSTDGTADLCRRFGAKVFVRAFDGFGSQKQFALEQTTGTWAFSIDADERVTPALAEEIRTLIRSKPSQNGFKVRRNFYFLGHRLRYGGLGADWVLRLFRRDQGRFRSVKVHESIEVNGSIARLKAPLEHYSYPTLGEYMEKCNHYTTLAAEEQWVRGRRFSWRDYLRPAWELGVRILAKGAWLDGRAGLTYARLSARAAWLRAVKLRDMENESLTAAPSNRFLIVRTDRLGDVLLTTPVSRLLREKFPQAHIAWWVNPYTAPLLEHNPDVDQVIIDQGGPLDDLIQRLRQEKFRAAIVAYPRWRVAWALWRSGIPLRIGPASKWYSVFFNRRLWQHRSEGKKHEADYNVDLLSALGVPFRRVTTRLVLTPEEKARARNFLESMRLSFHKPIVCLHPGSGGSSARWPLSHFMELGDRLQEAGYDVVVTGGPGEDYQNIMIDNMRRIPTFIAAGSVSVRQFGAILSCINLLITNSTGPLHIAVALGVATVSVYSPLPTCHPQRWGPYPAYLEENSLHTVFMPPDRGVLAGDMSAVTVDEVMKVCEQKLVSRQGVSVG